MFYKLKSMLHKQEIKKNEKKKTITRGKWCALLGMLLSLALLCGYVESLIPISFGIPGVKLGLANLVVVITLFYYGEKEAVLVSLLRILLSAFLFSSLAAFVYSLAGGVCSLLIMILLKRILKLHIISVSIAGGIFHNLGQLLIAVVILENTAIVYYFALLFAAGLVTGALIGILSFEVLKRITKSEHLF